MALSYSASRIKGVYEIQTLLFEDNRGAFGRLFCPEELEPVWQNRPNCQINYSYTRQLGALRGLHLQLPPHAEAKLIRCLRGRVWDIAVDLRPTSPTFLSWAAVELSAQLHNAILIPEGCAHGFQVLEPDSELLYLHSAFYHPETEAGLRWDDPRLKITWPLEVTDLSERDRQHPLLGNISNDPRLQALQNLETALGNFDNDGN
jgi:dTDP-4-dehydrorhamnose 3,5-epimerase